MTLLFGQFPHGAFVAEQFVLHAVVGGVADIVPPTPNVPSYMPYSSGPPVFVKRKEIQPEPVVIFDEDLEAALAVLIVLDNEY